MKKELKEKLKLHRRWLQRKEDGVRLELNDADFSGATLRHLSLTGAVLRRSNFEESDLRNVDFSSTLLLDSNFKDSSIYRCQFLQSVLGSADFTNAAIEKSNFSLADLSNANLTDASLMYVIGNGREVKSLVLSPYHIVYTNDQLTIGCTQMSIERWKDVNRIQAWDLDGGSAAEFYDQYYEFLSNLIELSPAL